MFRVLSLWLVLLAPVAPAAAAERSFTVTGFDRIRLDGPFQVKLATGVAPFAKASGSPAAIDGVSMEVEGETLIVRNNPSNWGSYPGANPGPVAIAVGTHELSMAWLNGSGSLSIDSVKGQSFDLSLQGSGSVSISRLTVDRLKAAVTGSGLAVVGGSAAEATVIVRGTATFDGSGLAVKDSIIGVEGSAMVKLKATATAKIDTRGTASVVLAGAPACTVRTAGSAVVSGCR